MCRLIVVHSCSHAEIDRRHRCAPCAYQSCEWRTVLYEEPAGGCGAKKNSHSTATYKTSSKSDYNRATTKLCDYTSAGSGSGRGIGGCEAVSHTPTLGLYKETGAEGGASRNTRLFEQADAESGEERYTRLFQQTGAERGNDRSIRGCEAISCSPTSRLYKKTGAERSDE
ncbi:hypothetical protein IFR05_003076 [Cadophora sp. M221]|nr:hypothetical protein IFR05_003076 [Cadophora sp. M221]